MELRDAPPLIQRIVDLPQWANYKSTLDAWCVRSLAVSRHVCNHRLGAETVGYSSGHTYTLQTHPPVKIGTPDRQPQFISQDFDLARVTHPSVSVLGKCDTTLQSVLARGNLLWIAHNFFPAC